MQLGCVPCRSYLRREATVKDGGRRSCRLRSREARIVATSKKVPDYVDQSKTKPISHLSNQERKLLSRMAVGRISKTDWRLTTWQEMRNERPGSGSAAGGLGALAAKRVSGCEGVLSREGESWFWRPLEYAEFAEQGKTKPIPHVVSKYASRYGIDPSGEIPKQTGT
jgi:hypothetical protein